MCNVVFPVKMMVHTTVYNVLRGEAINIKLGFFHVNWQFVNATIIENSSHLTVHNWFDTICNIWSIENINIYFFLKHLSGPES